MFGTIIITGEYSITKIIMSTTYTKLNVVIATKNNYYIIQYDCNISGKSVKCNDLYFDQLCCRVRLGLNEVVGSS